MLDQIQITTKARWWVLFALSGSLALAFLDQMNLPVALPTIQTQLKLSTLTLQWLINAYLLTWAVFVLTGGYLADCYGLKKIFCIGILIFGMGSLGSCFAFNGWWFIASRGVQGFGTALMLPAAIGILVSIFPKNEHGKAIGIYSGAASIFLIIGPLMGGVFTQFLSWRWIFLVNAPVVLFSYLVILATLPTIKPQKKKFDFLGFLFFTLGFPCFILALMQGNKWGWGHWSVITLFAFSAVALVIFFVIELKIETPFLDLNLFKSDSFLGSNIIFFVVQFILILPVYWAMFLQRILGYSPLVAGLYVMVAVVPLVIIIPLGGVLSDIRGHRFPVIIGLLFVFASLIWFFIFDKLTANLLVPGMIAFGSGIALVFAPISSCVVGGASAEQRGIASGVLGCVRQSGGTMGMAVISAMLTNLRAHHFFKRLKEEGLSSYSITTNQLDCFYFNTTSICDLSETIVKTLRPIAIDAYFFAFKWIYLLCAALVFFVVFVCWRTIPRKITQNKLD
ncbi:MAG: Multidrug resistance protein Stp [Chlamydiae bacterium]|nr:Multidrug resistance protein Stp [Chlamydiota bacterium]